MVHIQLQIELLLFLSFKAHLPNMVAFVLYDHVRYSYLLLPSAVVYQFLYSSCLKSLAFC